MHSQPQQIVQKLWNYCNILRDDGLSYGDYVEQLTFLLFLKMADEQTRKPYNKPSPVPADCVSVPCIALPLLCGRRRRDDCGRIFSYTESSSRLNFLCYS